MHQRLSRFDRFAPRLTANANGAEASAPADLAAPIRASIAQRFGSAMTALAVIVLTIPHTLLGQSVNPPTASFAGGAAPRSIISGRVVDQTGRPQINSEIAIKDMNGHLLRTLRTNTIGRYCFADLSIGHYLLTQDPSRAPFDGQTVVALLPPEGLFVDWRVAGNSAIALASTPRQTFDCGQFLAGGSLLEKIFGVASSEMLAGGSIAAGLGLAAGAAAGGRGRRPVASPSK
jgi:hypothetical protein